MRDRSTVGTNLFWRSGVVIAVSMILTADFAASAIAATQKVLYSFCSRQGCADGQYPLGSLINVNGTLYGTTYQGGGAIGFGTVFSITPHGKEKVVYSFGAAPDGQYPRAGLINVKGTLYGTTNSGGADRVDGTVFSVGPTTGKEKVLYSFAGVSDGAYPNASMVNVSGTLYGTTVDGGGTGCGDGGGCGTVFSIDPTTGSEKVLHSFGNGTRGEYPYGSLLNVKGALYGTTSLGGGNQDAGTVFSLATNGKDFKALHTFGVSSFDGQNPYGNLINVNGTLYGTTQFGGDGIYAGGTIFAINPSTGDEQIVYSFCSQQRCADGENPTGGLINVYGTLYGLTGDGGAYGDGTIFSVNPATGGENVLHSFDGTDGFAPNYGLVNVNGTLYGTTDEGGANGDGTVFSVTP